MVKTGELFLTDNYDHTVSEKKTMSWGILESWIKVGLCSHSALCKCVTETLAWLLSELAEALWGIKSATQFKIRLRVLCSNKLIWLTFKFPFTQWLPLHLLLELDIMTARFACRLLSKYTENVLPNVKQISSVAKITITAICLLVPVSPTIPELISATLVNTSV